MSAHIKHAREVIAIETQSLELLSKHIDKQFEQAIDAILKTKGRLVVTGVGKSGIIGKKISATLSSTGTPSMFLHPVEAFHGDLGMLRKEDIVLAISYSGETEELLKIIPYFRQNKIKLIGMSGNPTSTLATHSDFHLNIKIEKEACPLELAPTSSTTATLVLGDAIAVALMKARQFKSEDFARFHPGGSLGRRLLTTVENVMLTKNLPTVSENASLKEVINTMSAGRLGMAIVLKSGKISGIITDGDLRRAMDKHGETLFSMKAVGIMTKKPRTISKEVKMAEAEELMTKHKITSLLVEEKGKLIGVAQIYSVNL
jgi:arabinose-5-phosphate isomerase